VTTADLLDEARTLPVDEQLRLIGAVWDSIGYRSEVVSDAERELIDRRAAHMRAHPEEETDWQSVKARFDAKFA
jgi:putative addiction module component (TIGR02574 family)